MVKILVGGGEDKKPTITHLLRAPYTLKGSIHPKLNCAV
jgi:hypothetical protein